MKIQNLPLFQELSRVFCSYKIKSWEILDFWDKVKLLKVIDNKVNYRGVNKLIHQMVEEGYLTINVKKSRTGQKMYTETERLDDLRSKFCVESTSTLHELNLKKAEFENKINELEEEIKVLEEFKDLFPDIQFRIEQLKQTKASNCNYLKKRIDAISSLIDYLFT